MWKLLGARTSARHAITSLEKEGNLQAVPCLGCERPKELFPENVDRIMDGCTVGILIAPTRGRPILAGQIAIFFLGASVGAWLAIITCGKNNQERPARVAENWKKRSTT